MRPCSGPLIAQMADDLKAEPQGCGALIRFGHWTLRTHLPISALMGQVIVAIIRITDPALNL